MFHLLPVSWRSRGWAGQTMHTALLACRVTLPQATVHSSCQLTSNVLTGCGQHGLRSETYAWQPFSILRYSAVYPFKHGDAVGWYNEQPMAACRLDSSYLQQTESA